MNILLKILWYVINGIFRVNLLFLIGGFILDFFYLSGDPELQKFSIKRIIEIHIVLLSIFVLFYLLKYYLLPKYNIDLKKISFTSIIKEIISLFREDK